MHYALNIYAIPFILIPSTILLSIIFYIYQCSRKNKSYIPFPTTLLSVGISIYLLIIFELLVNFISSLREFRAKGFIIVTYTAFLTSFIYFSIKEKFRFTTTVLWLLIGSVAVIFAGVPVFFIFGCATGPVCM